MYETNRQVLKQIVEERSVIRPIAQHRNQAGELDVAGFKRIWNQALSRLSIIQLWETGAPGYDRRDPLQPEPSIAFIPADKEEKARGTILIAHGGGNEIRTGCEGFHTAAYFADQGFNTAILTYRLKPYTRFDAICDMQRAIRLLRAHRDELGITDKIAVMGFSAGGQLSANCATHYDRGSIEAEDPIERYSSRPDACVVGYGAFATVSFAEGLYFRSPYDDDQRKEKLWLAPEKNITTDTPPFFIWQTNSDDPRNSMVLAWALTEAAVPFELHCFPDGVHGLALCDGNNDLCMRIPHLMHWAELCSEWLTSQGI